jgi:murein DD-endopeptidase MepM/ murein hydrolase activator NlpD
MKSLELSWPLEHYVISQHFGENPNVTGYASGGHPGMDLITTFGDIIRFAAEGPVYKTINFSNADLMKYRAVMQLVSLDNSLDCYEITYGHCDKLLCTHGLVQIGDPVATEGNTGLVYSGRPSKLVTSEEKQAGSHAGFHLHFQLRYCRKVLVVDPSLQYLSAEDGQPYCDGRYYYSIPHYNNGCYGCIDPLPFMVARSARETGEIYKTLTEQLEFARKEIEKLKLRSA